MTEQDPQKPIQGAPAGTTPAPQTPAASPQPVNDVYGAVGAAQAQNVKKGHRGAILIGLVIAALVAAGLALWLFTQGTFTEKPSESIQRVALSEDRVTTAFEDAEMTPPDISQYAYVSQDELIGPKFSDIKIQEPVDLGAPANAIVECTATATATFKNKGVEIQVPVTLPFDYSNDSETWVPGDLTQGEVTATPLASAKASKIVENLDEILYAYDPTYGEEMAEAKVVKTNSDLSIDGGPITVELSKQVDLEKDKKKYNELRTAKVELKVEWTNDKGWKVSVANAGQIERTTTEIPDETDETTGEVVEPAKPVKLGKVSFGDKVNLSGTLQKVEKADELSKDNDYQDKKASKDATGKVQLVLKFTKPVTMTLDGKKYSLNSIAVATSGLSDKKIKALYGRKADVSGTLEDQFATSWSPAGIKALTIETTS